MTLIAYTGADVFDGTTLHQGAALLVDAGRVVAIQSTGDLPKTAIALAGGTLSPGFVDLQVNGGNGVMLGDAASVAGIGRICAAHARLGTTGLLPTLITDTPERTRAVIHAGIAAHRANIPGFLGLHLEGPHFDSRRKGAHDPALIRLMNDDDLALLLEAAAGLPALMITLAPEAVTDMQITTLAEAGVIVSLGHTDTSHARATAAFAAGATCATHLFNAMSPLGHREPGLVGAVLDSAVACGIICDGIHVAAAALRVALAAKPEGMFIVSDAMAVAGTDLSEFCLGARRILRRDGRLTLEDGTLAGADITMPASVAHLVQIGIPLEAALKMATSTPARLIRTTRGTLMPGAPADMVHLRPDLTPQQVWQAGLPLNMTPEPP